MEAHRTATAGGGVLREVDADLGEDADGGGVEVGRRGGLHAAGEQSHPPLPLEGRGRGWGAARDGFDVITQALRSALRAPDPRPSGGRGFSTPTFRLSPSGSTGLRTRPKDAAARNTPASAVTQRIRS